MTLTWQKWLGHITDFYYRENLSWAAQQLQLGRMQSVGWKLVAVNINHITCNLRITTTMNSVTYKDKKHKTNLNAIGNEWQYGALRLYTVALDQRRFQWLSCHQVCFSYQAVCSSCHATPSLLLSLLKADAEFRERSGEASCKDCMLCLLRMKWFQIPYHAVPCYQGRI